MKAARGTGSPRKDTKDALKPTDDRRVGKRKAAIKADNSNKRLAKKGKSDVKDRNKPKRPASAFFVFLEEFRKTYKLEHPNIKAVSAVGKAGGEKWKSLSKAEKAPYEAIAAKRKTEYEKLMTAYNKKQENKEDDDDDEEEEVEDEDEDEESDKSKSEVNDEDDEESEEEDEGTDDGDDSDV